MKSGPLLAPLAAAAAAAVSGAPPARADAWLVAETPAAFAISDAQERAFRPGLMPAVGAYADNGRLALGLRLRAGLLRNGPTPSGNVEDPGAGGLATASAAARLLLGPAWIEGAAGGGLTGSAAVPAVELGAGLQLALAGAHVGPSVRLVRVISRDGAATFGSADLVLAGIDIRFGGARRRAEAPGLARVAARPAMAAAVAPAPAPAAAVAPAATPPVDADEDRPLDRDASCAEALDGCPIAESVAIADGRIVLEDRVLFELNGARVRASGRAVIARIAQLWALHPEWVRLTVEGHACERGSDAYNQRLSEVRAARARALLEAAGIPAERLEVAGFGRARPRDPRHTEGARARNRRVEFVIERASAPGIAQGGRP